MVATVVAMPCYTNDVMFATVVAMPCYTNDVMFATVVATMAMLYQWPHVCYCRGYHGHAIPMTSCLLLSWLCHAIPMTSCLLLPWLCHAIPMTSCLLLSWLCHAIPMTSCLLLPWLHLHLHLGFVHPLQDVAVHQCLPSPSVCCFPNPGGSLLLCYVILPSSAWSSSRPLPSPWLPLCASPCPPIVL